MLQTNCQLPSFSTFDIQSAKNQIVDILNNNQQSIESLIAESSTPTWENFIRPLEQMDAQLSEAFSPLSHLSNVKDSDELREVYKFLIGKITKYQTQLGQNQGLFNRYQLLKQQPEFADYSLNQQQVIKNALLDFELAGIGLSDSKKAVFSKLAQETAQLSQQFSENVLDATQGFTIAVEDKKDLAGVPESALNTLLENGKQKEQPGYLITLDMPSYLPVMTYCENRKLRKQLYLAYVSRASNKGPCANQWDNESVLVSTLNKRNQMAKLLGFDSYADLSVAKKMASNPNEVLAFLTSLSDKVKPAARQEFESLQSFAQSAFGIESLQPWDIAFVSEKLKEEKFSINEELVRQYFPLPHVLNGLFKTVEKLYGLEVKEESVDAYHEDVKLYALIDNGKIIAKFYLDLFAREAKRGGAWMDDCRARYINKDNQQVLPVAYLVCNFTAPTQEQESTLTHNDVTTLFHEFGHGLHHMLTKIDQLDVSGINGVAWDAVELPSQFMENYCWQPEVLAYLSSHIETQEPLPKDMLDKMLEAKNFHSAMFLARQLEFACFDFSLHCHHLENYDADLVAKVINEVRSSIAVVPVVEENMFQNSFSHIFAGGYAAGYYSYLWAEVLSCDAFSLFEQQGIFDQTTGLKFRQKVLERGGSVPAMALFVDFRGRKPNEDALLRHHGIRN